MSESQDYRRAGHHATELGPAQANQSPQPPSTSSTGPQISSEVGVSQQRHLKTALPPKPGKRPSPPPPPQATGQTGAQHQGQDNRPEGASTCKVRSQCHLISEQVSLSYEVSLQFALTPLGGGFLKQRDRLGVGRESRPRRVEKRKGGGERETETQILNTTSKRPQCRDRQLATPPEGQPPTTHSTGKDPLRLRELRGAPSRAGWRRVNSNCKAKCETG